MSDRSSSPWPTARLGDAVSFEYGKALGAEVRSGDGFPVFGSSGKVGSHCAFLIQGPGIIVGRKGTVGSVTWSDRPFWPIDTTYYVRWMPSVELDRRWTYWRLATLPLSRLDSSTGVPGLNRNDAYQLTFPAPPPPEQRRIAEILDTVADAIRSTERLIAKLGLMKQGLLHDLLTRGIDENGELRDPLRHPDQFHETTLGVFPSSWKLASLQDVGARTPGSMTIGPFGSDLVASDYRTSGVPVIFVRDIREDGFRWISNVYISEEKAAHLAAHLVRPGDILATKMGLPPCVAALHPDDAEPAVITADVIRLRPDVDAVDAAWLVATINSESVREQVRAITGGVTRPKVTLRDVRRLLVAVPPITEQRAIRGVLASEDLQRQRHLVQLKKLSLLKRGLMDDLLAGRVRVTVDDEDAA
jgi:type I restriction enzyme, S subunit